MKTILLPGLLAATLLLTACDKGEFGPWVKGVGPVETETRAVNSFSRLEAKDHIDVILSQGAEPGVRLEAQRNILDITEARLYGNQLVLRLTKPTRGKDTQRVRAYVTVPSLTEVAVGDHAAVRSEATWGAGSFRVRVKDHGVAELTLDQTDELKADVKDHGNITLAGAAQRLDVDATGHGLVQAYDLTAQNGEATADDHGLAKVRVTGQLQAEARDHGAVTYRGRPAVSVRTSGHGHVGAED
ncbi:DUF2807 domain-containing protein [Hymenobacter sp. 15J16-1T3B]|uniref:head GIN domain-containing protein n=1 Tax=Hymenobacter sp. 15J16-1T3B TaxID=2886941 RepID=UPI001D124978|nr:head GIN domain-containing protein [Hymenobacter sp. 15J16-1T3B]MCC3155642.1 DUF2807 domain-containing protein [Hymenobacter sp. 15J16-1T3B]